jgi:hypothetical protein
VLIFTNDTEKLNKETGEYFDSSFAGYSLLYQNPTCIYMIFNFDNLGNHEHGPIAHEADHCTGYLFKERGCKPDLNNDEHFAYVSDWFTDTVYEYMKSILKQKRCYFGQQPDDNYEISEYFNYIRNKKQIPDIIGMFKFIHSKI